MRQRTCLFLSPITCITRRALLAAWPLLLAACGGGGGSDHLGGGPIVVQPPPPATSLRGTVIGSASVVPVLTMAGLSVDTIDPVALTALEGASIAATGTPTCSVTTYTLKYHTIDGMANDTDASTAIMVPSGSAAACQGGRPVLLYAHGTSVLKSTDMAKLSATEPRLVAAMYAAQGYIVVAPNYAGYAGSSLAYHPYLDSAQQAADMIDALRAARSVFAAIGAGASSRLMVTGYSQGGYVAMAAQRAMQTLYPAEFKVTAAAPLSGPYALLQFGDAIFNGAPTQGSSAFLPLVINAAQHANAGIYASTSEVYEAPYAGGIETLMPGTLGLGDLVAAGKLPNDVLFAHDSLPQASGYASYFGEPHLIKTSYRNGYLADLQAQPCNVDSSAPLNCAPAQALRRWLLKNDLRNYLPGVPMLLCGGKLDPLVPFANANAAYAYFRGRGMAASALTLLDVDDANLVGPYIDIRTDFAAAKALLRSQVLTATGSAAAADQAVIDGYHAGLVAPLCLRAARQFFDAAPN